uniref:hypothetical protein n=1 Tax=Microbacterium sp. SORGH_AS_1204 TaxID=3041785 RepID=UPI0027D82D4B|nr:hypothetical protein [Microbacterium sp. SORGH_AS_1204]
MDDGARRELETLRARAYGPDADIDTDPTAAQRLRELEEQQRERHSLPIAVRLPEAGIRGSESDARVPLVDADDPLVDADDPLVDADEPRERRPLVRSKRNLWAWAISLAVVTALASAATALSLTFVPVSNSVGAPQVGTLELDPDAETPSVFGQRTGQERAYRDFYGVTAFVGYAQTDATENRNPCIYLLDSDEVAASDSSGIRGNFVYGGCGAGVFPATVQFVVAEGMPEAFVERFPVGSSVQFVFDGENVGVFSDRG